MKNVHIRVCKTDKSLNRVRQYCHIHNIDFRTIKSKNIVTYKDLDKHWIDVIEYTGVESEDFCGQKYYKVG